MTTSESIVRHPDIKLEDVRNEWKANTHTGRGTETAAARGYNTERLAKAVLGKYGHFTLSGINNGWYDTLVGKDGSVLHVECKSCVYRYPSGAFGRFRIWEKNHTQLLEITEYFSDRSDSYLYFFVVYAIEEEIEKEVGKLVVPVKQVDRILDGWSTRDHSSMGEEPARDISWNMLLNRLEISRDKFEDQNILDLTTETSRDRE